jgi:hypothetical protein
MAADEQQLDQVQGIQPRLCLMPGEGRAHDVIKPAAHLLVALLKAQALEETVLRGEIVDGDGENDTRGGEDDAVGGAARFEEVPGVGKGEVVDVPVDPVAVLKVVLDEAVDDVNVGEEGEQVAVVFVRHGREVFGALALAV